MNFINPVSIDPSFIPYELLAMDHRQKVELFNDQKRVGHYTKGVYQACKNAASIFEEIKSDLGDRTFEDFLHPGPYSNLKIADAERIAPNVIARLPEIAVLEANRDFAIAAARFSAPYSAVANLIGFYAKASVSINLTEERISATTEALTYFEDKDHDGNEFGGFAIPVIQIALRKAIETEKYFAPAATIINLCKDGRQFFIWGEAKLNSLIRLHEVTSDCLPDPAWVDSGNDDDIPF
ncbi:hypothetical protein PSQ90_14970 [Devosia rhodophyticola]|uniref:RES domain-containing protein n=1 Tax=Devosia rhodophyticola TaxID=3026423 RepID=A0ABY7YXD0_9HYPH|nr:hypothetical protein [Devosia rhodophyticola]WDR05559.1 hypothetical protein PSQ90_14970 [Devosia rhodophyticola]